MDLRLDKGALIENTVLMELMKSASVLQDLHFWRTQAKTEVAIVLADKGNAIPIEIKYQPFKRPKVAPSLAAFIENYKPEKAYIVTREFSGYIRYNNCDLKFIPAFLSSKVI